MSEILKANFSRRIAEAFALMIGALNDVSPAVLSFSLFGMGCFMSLASYLAVHFFPVQTSEISGELISVGPAIIAAAAMSYRTPDAKNHEKSTDENQPK